MMSPNFFESVTLEEAQAASKVERIFLEDREDLNDEEWVLIKKAPGKLLSVELVERGASSIRSFQKLEFYKACGEPHISRYLKTLRYYQLPKAECIKDLLNDRRVIKHLRKIYEESGRIEDALLMYRLEGKNILASQIAEIGDFLLGKGETRAAIKAYKFAKVPLTKKRFQQLGIASPSAYEEMLSDDLPYECEASRVNDAREAIEKCILECIAKANLYKATEASEVLGRCLTVDELKSLAEVALDRAIRICPLRKQSYPYGRAINYPGEENSTYSYLRIVREVCRRAVKRSSDLSERGQDPLILDMLLNQSYTDFPDVYRAYLIWGKELDKDKLIEIGNLYYKEDLCIDAKVFYRAALIKGAVMTGIMVKMVRDSIAYPDYNGLLWMLRGINQADACLYAGRIYIAEFFKGSWQYSSSDPRYRNGVRRFVDEACKSLSQAGKQGIVELSKLVERLMKEPGCVDLAFEVNHFIRQLKE